MFQEGRFFKEINSDKSLPKQRDIFGLENLTEAKLIERFLVFDSDDEVYVDGKRLPKDENGDFADIEDFISSSKYNEVSESEKRKNNAIAGTPDVEDDYLEKSAILKKLAEIGTRKAIDLAVNFSGGQENAMIYYRKEIMNILEIDKNYSAEKILNDYKNGQMLSITSEFMIIITTDLIGVEEVRQKINNLIEKNKQLLRNGKKYFTEGDIELDTEGIIYELETARVLITPNHDKIAIENLQKFYQEKIKFEDYKVNKEMNDSEVALLQGLINKNEKILEEGCGTGRLLLEMKKAGYDITGFDFTERHVDIVKEQDAEAKVMQGDWHKTEYANESFDAVYSLGRNILHDYSIVDQAQLFREANRVLKPGGKFIFDIPNREEGGYKMMVDEYANEMEKRGIRNFRYGTIYDSPDGKYFATRYAFSHEDIEQMAQLTGFEIKEVQKKDLPTGHNDENLYYVLTKK